MKTVSHSKSFLFGLFLVVLCFSIIAINQIKQSAKIYQEKFDRELELRVKSFSTIPLEAGSVYIFDVNTNTVLFQKDADKIRGIASITKLATLSITNQVLREDEVVPISTRAQGTEGISVLNPGSNWNKQDLEILMIAESSNDGAEALNEKVNSLGGPTTIERMNAKMKDIGLSQTKFANPTGLDIGNSLSNTSTAKEITKLAQYVLFSARDIVGRSTKKEIVIKNQSGNSYVVKNTNIILEKIPNIVLSKTGYTDLAGGNLVVAFVSKESKHTIIITVLGSTKNGRFSDTLRLVEAVENYFKELNHEITS